MKAEFYGTRRQNLSHFYELCASWGCFGSVSEKKTLLCSWCDLQLTAYTYAYKRNNLAKRKKSDSRLFYKDVINILAFDSMRYITAWCCMLDNSVPSYVFQRRDARPGNDNNASRADHRGWNCWLVVFTILPCATVVAVQTTLDVPQTNWSRA